MIKNRFLVLSGGGEKARVLWAAKAMALFRINDRRRNESHQYVHLNYIDVTRLIDTVDQTLVCLCQK